MGQNHKFHKNDNTIKFQLNVQNERSPQDFQSLRRVKNIRQTVEAHQIPMKVINLQSIDYPHLISTIGGYWEFFYVIVMIVVTLTVYQGLLRSQATIIKQRYESSEPNAKKLDVEEIEKKL